MSFGKRLRDFFSDKQANAIGRARKKIHARCEWDEVKNDIFPEKGTGAPVKAVVGAIIEAKHWKLLTPLVTEAGDWVGVIDLVYRQGDFRQAPPGRAQELEEIYKAVKAAPKHGKKVTDALIETALNWACQHGNEEVFDWAKSKPEFKEIPQLGLAALCERKIEGNALAMKVLATKEDLAKAIDAVDWVYESHSGDRYDALQNIEAWRKKLDEKARKPKPPGPVF